MCIVFAKTYNHVPFLGNSVVKGAKLPPALSPLNLPLKKLLSHNHMCQCVRMYINCESKGLNLSKWIIMHVHIIWMT